MSSNDDLTQREKRALRHQQNKRRERPEKLKRNWKKSAPLALILLTVTAAGAGIYYLSTSGPPCPDHWHGTFGVYLPGPGGQPERVDLAAPRTASGAKYYDYGSARSGGAGFSMTLHMHQSGSESGSEALGPSQWHMEGGGKCISIASALRVVNIDPSADSLTLSGAHSQVPGQSGTFSADQNQTLRWQVESLESSTCTWTWKDWTWANVKGHQLQDGERLLVVLGHSNETQMKSLQDQIPLPISRAGATGACKSSMQHEASTTSRPSLNESAMPSMTMSESQTKP